MRKPHPETCERCPNRYSRRGCPAWIRAEYGLLERDDASGQDRITTGCMWHHLPRWLAKDVASNNRTTKAIEKCRNVIDDAIKGFRKDVARVNRIMVAMQMQRDGQIIPGVEGPNGHAPAIEHQPDEADDASD